MPFVNEKNQITEAFKYTHELRPCKKCGELFLVYKKSYQKFCSVCKKTLTEKEALFYALTK